MKPTFSIAYESPSTYDKVHERNTEEVNRALNEFPGRLSDGIGTSTMPYLFGSTGRRLAFAIQDHGIQTTEEFNSLSYGYPNMPRMKKKGVYDLDVAMPEDTVSWSKYADLARQESNRYPHIYIDPHLLRTVSVEGDLYMFSQHSYGEQIPILLSSNQIETSDGHYWNVPDVWTHLALTLAYASVRVSDIPELKTLALYASKDKSHHPNKEVVLDYLAQYLIHMGPLLDASRAVYMTAFPEEIRNKLQIRNRLHRRKLREKVRYNYQKEDPVYF